MSEDKLRQTPLAARHVDAGARMVEFAGWQMPVQYAGLAVEHRAVRDRAGLFDVSHMGEIRIRGGAAEDFLQRLTPNDVAKLAPGRVHYSALLTEQGTYLDDLLVYRLAAEEFLLVVNAANTASDLEWIVSQRSADVEVQDVSSEYALLAIQGPAAERILQPLTDVELAPLRYYRFAQGQVDGRAALVSRTGYTGEDGFELYLAWQDAPPIWDALLAAGGAEGLQPAGLGARNTLRLEAGMALYGHEIDETTTPLEAGLEWTVKLGKGEFIGRQAIERQKRDGPQRRLVGFELTGRGIARDGHALLIEGRKVGEVTSGTWGPTLEKAVGMAYVPLESARPGTPVSLDVRGRLVDGIIVELPFYRRAS